MSSRKSSARRRKQEKSSALQLDGVRLAGVAVAIVIIASGIWLYILTHKSTQSTPTPVANFKQWVSPPPMTIDKSKQYFATVKMVKGGEFVIQLYPDKAPITVNSFVFLARQGLLSEPPLLNLPAGFVVLSCAGQSCLVY